MARKRRTYTNDEIIAFKSALSALPKLERPRVVVGANALYRELRAEINEALKRGHTLDEIATVLGGRGADITASTLKASASRRRRPPRTAAAPL